MIWENGTVPGERTVRNTSYIEMIRNPNAPGSDSVNRVSVGMDVYHGTSEAISRKAIHSAHTMWDIFVFSVRNRSGRQPSAVGEDRHIPVLYDGSNGTLLERSGLNSLLSFDDVEGIIPRIDPRELVS